MSDLPQPKPPKPSGLNTPPGASGVGGNTPGSQIRPPASLNQRTSQPTSGQLKVTPPSPLKPPQATSTSTPKVPPPAKPPAAVTALHSVMPSGIPEGANKVEDETDKLPTPSLEKPTLSSGAKVTAKTRAGVGGGNRVIGGNQAVMTPPPSAPPPTPSHQTPKVSSPPNKEKPGKPAKPAKPKKSFLSKLPFIFGGLAILLVVGVVAFKFFGGKSKTTPTTPGGSATAPAENNPGGQTGGQAGAGEVAPGETVELEYWGLWEPEEVMQVAIDEFEQNHPGVSIRYVKQSPKNYRERLQTAIASGNGPDMFRYHATWVPMMADDLAPLPASIMSPSEFQETFYSIATKQLQYNGQLVGLPLEYDGLMLFYNKDILQAANESPPTSWAQVRSLAAKLTLKEGNKIKRAGIALGTAENTDHFSDILGLLMLQNGADLTNPDSPEVRDALIFYTNFVKTDGVWDETLPNSTVAFARGEAAMMLAPSWRAHEIKNINPELKFATAPLPRVVEENTITWASYWAEGVNKQGKNQDMAWQFLKFLTSKEMQKKLFAQASTVRAFGEPYSRVDLAAELSQDPILASLMTDATKADSWYLCSNTFDNGINDQIIKYYKDAVNALLSGKDITKVLPTLSQGVQEVLSQYNVTK